MVSLRKLMETRKRSSSLIQKTAKPASSGNRRKPESNKRKKPMHFKAEDIVMKRAKEIEESLPAEFPKFIKPFTPAYDNLGCMRLPQEFCKDHMSEADRSQRTVTLLNERGEEYKMNLHMEPKRKELNGGWTVFSTENNLCVGDVLVFQLVEPSKFKVYVVRVKDFEGRNGSPDSKKLRLARCPEEERPLVHLKVSARIKRKWSNTFSLRDTVMERAKEIMASLDSEIPNCLQTITPSYDQRGCLRLPEPFCQTNLLGDKGIVTLVNESGNVYNINYLKNRKELGGGWRQFSKENKVCVGDVLIFQLIGHFRLKVIIVRANVLAGADRTHDPQLNSCIKQTNSGELPIVTFGEHIPNENILKMASDTEVGATQSDCGSEEIALDSQEGHARLPVSTIDFKEVKSIEDFTIIINGLNIDDEISEEERAKYYKLCCSQKSYLHDHLMEDINTSEWAATIIKRTVKTADDIKASQFSTPRSDYESWDKILNSFELLGMNVGFLRARLKRLMNFASESEGGEILRRRVEMVQALEKAEENIKSLELDISMLEEKKNRLEMLKEKREGLVGEIKGQSKIAKKYEDIFRKEVDAEW